MDVKSYFVNESTKEEQIKMDRFKSIILKLANKGYLNTLQYSYFVEFSKTFGTLCNINWFLEQIENIKPNNENDIELITQFKEITGDAFDQILKYKNDELRINKNVKYYMSRTDTINLTTEQKNAMHKLYDFVTDYNKKVYGLYGYAGTGKTTTVVEFVSYMLLHKYLNSVALTAPTNKAVNVIKSKFKHHLRKIIEYRFNRKLETNFNFDDELDYLEQNGIIIKFMTIHKLLMFHTDFSIDGEMIFIRNDNSGSMISEFELVVVDECSMIGIDMIDSIFDEIRNIEKINSNKRKNYAKIIFTGDPAQLPPVNEDDSSIFCKNEQELTLENFVRAMNFKSMSNVMSNMVSMFEYKHKLLIEDLSKMETTLLTNVVRSRLDNVTKVCHEFRLWIKNEDLPNLYQFKDKTGVHFFEYDNRDNKIKSEWFNKFLESIKKNETSIIITWTNKQTDLYNEVIRRNIFRGKKIAKFEKNDILMLSEFYSLDLGEEFVKQKLYTSEQIKVIDTSKSEIPIRIFEPISNKSIRSMKNGSKEESRVKQLTDGLNEIYCKDVKFKCWILKVEKLGDDSGKFISLIVIDDEDLEKYNKHKNESGMAIKKFCKQLLHQYRTSPKQIERLIIKPLWKQWNKVFVDSFANVNYGYSITCHKAQGSSFYNVYVDLHDILQNKQRPIEAKKCAYTATTRTSNELNILV